MQVLKDLLGSKKAIASLAAVIVDLVIAFGVPMDMQAKTSLIGAISGLAAAYVIAQGIADAGKEKAKVESKSAQPPA